MRQAALRPENGMSRSSEKLRDELPDELPRSVVSDSPTGLGGETPSRPRTTPPVTWFMLGLLALVVAAAAVASLRLSPQPPAKADPTAAATVLTPLTQRSPPH